MWVSVCVYLEGTSATNAAHAHAHLHSIFHPHPPRAGGTRDDSNGNIFKRVVTQLIVVQAFVPFLPPIEEKMALKFRI